jgi:hypothetical protein
MSENPAADAERTKWEYRTLFRKTEEYLVDDLNELGEEGWDVVAIEYHKDPGGMGDSMIWTAFLKRPYTGERPVSLKHAVREADEIAKKKKFLAAQLDDSEPEFAFEGELKPRPQAYSMQDFGEDLPGERGGVPQTQPDAGELKFEPDAEELKLEDEGGGLKLEGEEGELKLAGDNELTLEDAEDDGEVLEAEAILEDEEEQKD